MWYLPKAEQNQFWQILKICQMSVKRAAAMFRQVQQPKSATFSPSANFPYRVKA
jgi:hypothetical protein